jgi:polyphosphate kinase
VLENQQYLNRELSWLAFNRRVLALAQDPTLPLLERVKFLAIHGSNLDEFFQVRVAGLRVQVEAGVQEPSPDGLTPSEALRAVQHETRRQYRDIAHVFNGEIAPLLSQAGIELVEPRDLDITGREWVTRQFRQQLFPVLTPLAVDPAHPFPYISDLSLNLAVFVRGAPGGSSFARVKVPPNLPRYLMLPDRTGFVSLESVIAHHLDELFPGLDVLNHSTFRVTRNADIDVNDDESDDLLALIEQELARRRFGEPVRLEVSSELSEEALDLLTRELHLTDDEVFVSDAPLDLTGLWSIYAADRPNLKFEAHSPRVPADLRPVTRGSDMFSTLREHTVLVHHPYESFTDSVGEFLRQAAADPDVLAIKMTMYRTSERTQIVDSLIAAAKRGKQVVVVVEIKARFDEQANIEWARILEQSGVHVAYGVVGLKTHCKIALVVREERERIRRYTHIGTGNYNADTARIYEDLGLLTADDDIASDVSELFNALTGYSEQTRYRRLVVAPQGVRATLLALIESEANHPDGNILMKMNALVDTRIIDALYDASNRGCRVELLVRGICCLVPGVPGMSENITVRSVVGRFLEHSRVYRFGSAARGYTHLMGSADAMPRNLDGRVEALVPIDDPALADELEQVLALYLDPAISSWTLGPDGTWRHQPGEDLHRVLLDRHEGDPR